ncbi:cysteine desulfurase [Friedmanniella endophytica]|uniref:Cysteine desulfurase n=1 Tax=Microlunatus kandeliicorticis TaxID=1759536 RepID=A0A7W3ISE1_9ACTN|nr:aminotransferase class V-fold PLP-dependent enzyme [Microlunatus kandeliicorticis]MBA8794394.1 cysteine desulfurase [Microlunatus kandeliicorticis]
MREGPQQEGRRVFLDGSAGEPLRPEAVDAWVAAAGAGWGDPLALHHPGRQAAMALDGCRAAVADVVGARPEDVVFTGSAAQARRAAVAGLALGRRRAGTTVVTTTVEHSAVLAAADEVGGFTDPADGDLPAGRVGVDALGRLDLDQWRAAVAGPGVALACLQVGNHEVGTRQPVEPAVEAAVAAGVPVVLDATAAFGRVDLRALTGWSALVGGADAVGGPASVGFLVLARGSRWRPPHPVDDYQDGRWPGTPDLPGIVAATTALDATERERPTTGPRIAALVDRLRAGVADRVPLVELVGDPVDRLPHLLTFSVLYVTGEALATELDRAGFAVGSGSACSSRSEVPSHVLAAMGALTSGNVRLGLTRDTTADDVEAFLDVLPGTVAELRDRLGAP